MNSLWQDIRYGVRGLFKTPGFTIAAALTLALSIGANSAIFSVVNAYLIRPLPVRNPDQLVVVATKDHHLEYPHMLSFPNYESVRDHCEAFSDVMAFAFQIVGMNVNGKSERAWVELVSRNYFSMLGVEAVVGRTFLPQESRRAGVAPVVILSYGLWQRRFASDTKVIGTPLDINGRPFTIVGVLPESFPGTETMLSMDAYVPIGAMDQLTPGSSKNLQYRDEDRFRVIARLKPSFSVEQARAAVDVLGRQLQKEYRDTNYATSFVVVPETKSRPTVEVAEVFQRIAAVLTILVAFVLLIASANIANLILSRASARQKEFAIRASLGASRRRLVQQLLTESVVLALFGGSIGVAISFYIIKIFTGVRVSADLPSRIDVHPDWRVFTFTLIVAFATGIISGLVPALRASKTDLAESLKESTRSLGGPSGRHRLRSLLVLSQVALSLFLLICSGLFIQSLKNAQRMDLGFNAENQLMLQVDLSQQGYSEEKGRQFYKDLVDRIQSLPGVKSASLAYDVPLGYHTVIESIVIDGFTSSNRENRVGVFTNAVWPDYFRTMEITLLSGREFDIRDDESSMNVAVISEAMAKRYWPNQDPLGKKFRLYGKNQEQIQIIGVTKNSKYLFLDELPRPILYLPFRQHYHSSANLHVRTTVEPSLLINSVHHTVEELDKDILVYDTKTMIQHLHDGRALLFVRIGAIIIFSFSALGLILAIIGIYGVISFVVNQRTHEIGVRIALGAEPGDVLRLVVGQGMKLALVGVLIGLLAAVALTRLMANLLYGVSATDPVTFTVVTLLLVGVALIASYIPARRATKVDPMVALRYE